MLSFGLTSAPATLQQAMHNVFSDMTLKPVLMYLNDILVFSKSEQERLVRLEEVPRRLHEEKLYVKMYNAAFSKHHCFFLGHVINADGEHVDPKKTAVVKAWLQPKDVSQRRPFLGTASYFCKFVWNYATRVVLLTALTKILLCGRSLLHARRRLTTSSSNWNGPPSLCCLTLIRTGWLNAMPQGWALEQCCCGVGMLLLIIAGK